MNKRLLGLTGILAFSLMGAGCTVSEWKLGNGAKVYLNAPGIAENRCDELMTVAQAKEATGLDITSRKATMSSRETHLFNATHCDFFMGDSTTSQLTLWAFVQDTPEGTQKSYDFWKRDSDPIKDLGDQAMWVPDLHTVYMMVGGIRFTVGSISVDRSVMESIAKTVVPRLDAAEWAKQMREFRG